MSPQEQQLLQYLEDLQQSNPAEYEMVAKQIQSQGVPGKAGGKPARQGGTSGRPLDLWVAHSTAEYATAHLEGDDPPDLDDPAAVLSEMQAAALATIAEATGTAEAATVAHASVFAWDHAQTTASSKLPATHLVDSERRAGVCGDFFAGPAGLTGAEAAATSGLALAEALAPLLLVEQEKCEERGEAPRRPKVK